MVMSSAFRDSVSSSQTKIVDVIASSDFKVAGYLITIYNENINRSFKMMVNREGLNGLGEK